MSIAKEARVTGKLPNGAIKSRQLYSRWNAMRRRCYDPSFVAFPYYGARGVKICDEWRCDYLAFQKWAMAHGWKRGLTLDRIDSHGNYCPDNCRWITLAEQQCNRAEWNIVVMVNGETMLAGHWADRNRIPRSLVFARIRKLGWDPVKAVTTPSSHNGRRTVTVDGETHTVYAWAKLLGIGRSWLYQQIRSGRKPSELIRKHRRENEST